MTTDPRPAPPEPAMQAPAPWSERLVLCYPYLAAEELRENRAQIERLQRALAFWLPGVPADDPEVAQRAGDDAHLLAGSPVSGEPDAEDLGWIRLREPP